jgi:hypothetical protein
MYLNTRSGLTVAFIVLVIVIVIVVLAMHD